MKRKDSDIHQDANKQRVLDQTNNAPEDVVLPAGEPMEIDNNADDTLFTQPQYSPLIIRLSESLLRSRDILDALDEDHYDIFVSRYQIDVIEGLNFLSRFRPHYEDIDSEDYNLNTIAEVLDNIVAEEEFETLLDMDKLSIVAQLETILARWRTQAWILQNVEFIEWCKVRNTYYPQLFNQLVGVPVRLNESETMLGEVHIEWLVDLVHPHLNSDKFEDNIGNSLTDPRHHEAVLSFSAQIEHIDKIKLFASRAESKSLLSLLNLVHRKREFFNVCIDNTNGFRKVFANYISASATSKNLMRSLLETQSLKLLTQLLAMDDLSQLIGSEEHLAYFRPLLNCLLENALNGRLEMLITLWELSLNNPGPEHHYLKALTWLEKNRSIIAASFVPENAFAVWLEHQQDYIKLPMLKFSHSLMELLTATEPVEANIADEAGVVTRQVSMVPVCLDTRPGKVSQSTFPSPLACFEDAIAGLNASHRSSNISCVEGDVLLHQFLSHPQNKPVLVLIQTHMQNVQTLIHAYEQCLASKRVEQIERGLPRPLVDALNLPPRMTQSVPRLRQKVILPRQESQQRRLDMENEREQEELERANRVGMKL